MLFYPWENWGLKKFSDLPKFRKNGIKKKIIIEWEPLTSALVLLLLYHIGWKYKVCICSSIRQVYIIKKNKLGWGTITNNKTSCPLIDVSLTILTELFLTQLTKIPHPNVFMFIMRRKWTTHSSLLQNIKYQVFGLANL